jgi:hypothetical protein
MTSARWAGAALFVVAGLILGLALAILLTTSTWGGIFTAVPCSDEETNPASLCRNGYYLHGWPGWAFMVGGLMLAVGVSALGVLFTREARPRVSEPAR